MFYPFTFVIDSTFLNFCQKIFMCVFYSMSFLLKYPIIQKTFISQLGTINDITKNTKV